MNNETYQGIIGILLLIITSLIWILLHQPSASVAYVTQEQTPFQWHCPAEPKVNCSTVVVPVATVTEKIKNYTASEDGDSPEPVPTGNPVPTIIPVPTTTMPVPEFPFLNSH